MHTEGDLAKWSARDIHDIAGHHLPGVDLVVMVVNQVGWHGIGMDGGMVVGYGMIWLICMTLLGPTCPRSDCDCCLVGLMVVLLVKTKLVLRGWYHMSMGNTTRL